MCGIAGWIDARSCHGDTALNLQRMLTSIAHRGPDDVGVWFSQEHGVALGHRRLAIQDLSSAGHQPMLTPDGRSALVYNGEIYNAPELRRALPRNVPWRGHSDTEVLLHGLRHWGVEPTLARLNGMFAFAYWDASSRTVTLARDRLGIKPLFYSLQGQRVWWASELKALLTQPNYQAEVDEESLAEFLRFGYVAAPKSMLRRTWKLLPGSWLTIRVDEPEKPVSGSYWSIASAVEAARADPAVGDDHELIDETERLLREVTRQHLLADVPVSTFLSGGIDSSLVASMMRCVSGGPITSYTIGFDDPRFDEAPHARRVAELLGLDHRERYASQRDIADLVPTLPDHYCEPLGDTSALPTLLVARTARASHSVVLSGDGGDELFAGYRRYESVMRWWSRLARCPAPLRRGAAGTLAVLPDTVLRHLQSLQRLLRPSISDGLPESARKFGTILRAAKAEELYQCVSSISFDANRQGMLLAERNEPSDAGPQHPQPNDWDPRLSLLENMQVSDCRRYLPDDILAKMDIASMSVGLEVRVPWLDHRVFEWAWRLPTAWKAMPERKHTGGLVGKRILREVLQRHLPSYVVERPKRGFSAPLDDWLRGPLRGWAEHLLDGALQTNAGVLNGTRIQRYWWDLQSGQAGHARIWPVLVYLAWHEHYLDNRSVIAHEHHLRHSSDHPVSVGC